MSAFSKTEQLQSLLQNQLDTLKGERLGKIEINHCVVLQGPSPLELPSYTSGNLCRTIANLRNCPNARVYIQVPTNREGVVPTSFNEQLALINNSLKMSAIAGGDVLVQSGLGPPP